jgi:elongation factor P
MKSASQVKRGDVIEVNGQPHIVKHVDVKTPSARGGVTLYKIRANNAVTSQKTDLSCRGDESFVDLDLIKRPIQYLYRDTSALHFMDLEDYSQFSMTEEQLAEESNYLLEDMELTALSVDDRVLGVSLPDTVNLQITECDPSIKGASATARTKPATLETGLVVQVPEYLSNGETVKVDTRTGKFLGRAK